MPNRIQKNYSYYLGKDIIMEKNKKKRKKNKNYPIPRNKKRKFTMIEIYLIIKLITSFK